MALPLLALLAILVAASVMYGYIVILVIIVAYVLHIPFAIRTKAWLREHPEVWDDKPKEQRQARRAIRRAQPRRTDRGQRRSTARLRLRRPGPRR
ncbi:CDP-diacylglycerol--serine O-phosphatidyltransferase [Mycobacteroides abscessus subsp. abscessus]|nr:CDP-diacylglycerol--serine O-phosphatidyltransferase [Mycobacteroides abscessus subsp. abscessus]